MVLHGCVRSLAKADCLMSRQRDVLCSFLTCFQRLGGLLQQLLSLVELQVCLLQLSALPLPF